MRRAVIIFMVSIFLFSGLWGCEKLNIFGPKKITPKKVEQVGIPVRGMLIAKVNNIPITLEDLNQEIETFNSIVPEDRPEAKINTKEKKVDYLKNEMVRRALLYQEALDRNLDKDERIQKALEKTRQDLMVMELVKQEADKVTVSSAEIEDYYNQFKEQLKEPEERWAREIMVPTEIEAREILIELLKGVDFTTLARQRSKAASAKDGGDLGFISQGKKFAQFDEIAFSESLDTGAISNIIRGPDGYYILKLEGKRGGKQKPLSELWDDIKRGLLFLKQQQRIEDLIGRLSQAAKIEIYEGKIE